MTKKIYNQPQTEIALCQTEPMMQFINVSVNGSYPPGGGGGGGAPIGD